MDLNSPIEKNFRLADGQKKALKKLGIKTINDLLYHFPIRYGDTSEKRNIGSLVIGEKAVIFGKISGLKMSKGFKSKIAMAQAQIEDESGKIKSVWFHQPYIAKMIQEGSFVRLEGKVSQKKSLPRSEASLVRASTTGGELYLSNPKIETVAKLPIGVGDSLFNGTDELHSLYPVYPESKGITSNWFYHVIHKIFNSGVLDDIKDAIPEYILSTYNLPSLKTALIWIHTPQKQDDATSARKRFAYEEVFFIQLQKKREKIIWNKSPSYVIEKTSKDIEQFVKTFPFIATEAQNKAIEQIMTDFKSGHAMSRLLEGDVGSGKTAVAATTAFSIVTSKPKGQNFGNLQVAYMAPTEILAKQHFESFIEYFTYLNINIGLITGKECRKFPSKVNPKSWTKISKTQLLKWVENGEVPILIGTHALIQKSVKFKHLAYSIVDEQHRFGVSQRYAVARGKNAERTQNNINKVSDLLYEDLTYKIRNVLFNVKKELGGGHKEVIYQRAVEEELTKNKINYKKEVQIPIYYNEKKIGIYQPDFVIDNKVILELKAINFIGATEKKQLWTYLKGSDFKLALLANFGPQELKIERVIYEKSRDSAYVPHSSAPVPHLLSMTATPIPRTLALTIYGDLDLTLLDQMPSGRKPILSEIVLPEDRENTYIKIKSALKEGRQVYVICPRIDIPDPENESAIIAKSVKEEAERLKKDIFQNYEIGILHSKMLQGEKEDVMNDFKEGKIHILVATSVVEVGVNVPNATVIIIEGAERFGLAQLHQLRGRVIRSNHQAYCYVFADSKTDKTLQRLKAFKNSSNGFELAEFDLKLRGPGELSGNKQWGISDIGMEAIRNLKMVEAARAEAEYLLSQDETLSKFPLINEKLSHRKKDEIHFE
jgi:ATP-dependent DNA helicase RecG